MRSNYLLQIRTALSITAQANRVPPGRLKTCEHNSNYTSETSVPNPLSESDSCRKKSVANSLAVWYRLFSNNATLGNACKFIDKQGKQP